MAGETSRGRGRFLVAAQFALLAALFLTGPVVPRAAGPAILASAALALVFWSVATMGPRNLHVAPAVAPDARLVTRGPYRYIRHPMYTAALAFVTALVWNHPTAFRAILWLLTIALVAAKARLEEKLLAERFADYAVYRRHTKRFLPAVY